jgi:hypothetical protein
MNNRVSTAQRNIQQCNAKATIIAAAGWLPLRGAFWTLAHLPMSNAYILNTKELSRGESGC